MAQIIRSVTRIARKLHQCGECLMEISNGERYVVSVTIGDGTIFRWRAHEDCAIAGDIYHLIFREEQNAVPLYECQDAELIYDSFPKEVVKRLQLLKWDAEARRLLWAGDILARNARKDGR